MSKCTIASRACKTSNRVSIGIVSTLQVKKRGHIIPFLIPNVIGVESTFRGIKIQFLCHSKLWQVFCVRLIFCTMRCFILPIVDRI